MVGKKGISSQKVTDSEFYNKAAASGREEPGKRERPKEERKGKNLWRKRRVLSLSKKERKPSNKRPVQRRKRKCGSGLAEEKRVEARHEFVLQQSARKRSGRQSARGEKKKRAKAGAYRGTHEVEGLKWR